MAWAKANPDRKKALDREYKKRNAARISPVKKAWRIRNRNRIAIYDALGIRRAARWYVRTIARKTNTSPEVTRRRILIRRAGPVLVFLTAARQISKR